MTLTYLVPLDGTDLSERAIPYAVGLARPRAGRLALVRACELDASEETERYLAAIAARLDGQLPVETVTRSGSPAEAILRESEDRDVDCIVMATRARTGPGHLMYGSVAEEVVKRSSVPVLVVPASAQRVEDFDDGAVVVALDGSDVPRTMLDAPLRVLGDNGRLIVLTYVVQQRVKAVYGESGHVVSYIDQRENAARRAATDYLFTVAGRLHHRFPGRLFDIDVRFGDPASGIVEAARERRAALTVMMTRGRTRLGRALHGSVAGQVLALGSTPVLLLHTPSAVLAKLNTERVNGHRQPLRI